MIPLIFGAVAVLAIGYYIWTQKDIYKLSWALKGPISVPLIGSTWMIAGRTHEGRSLNNVAIF